MRTLLMAINDPTALALAIEILAEGGLVAFPTDTVYGLGANAFSEQAVNRIYDLKGRLGEKPIPVLIGDLGQLPPVTSGFGPQCQKLARRFWPGPLTIVLPRNTSIPDAVSTLPTVGVRIPNFQPTLELLRLTGPLAVTAANLSGQGASTTARGVQAQFDHKIALILDGGVTPGGTPSTVMECTRSGPVILREGPISLEQLRNALI